MSRAAKGSTSLRLLAVIILLTSAATAWAVTAVNAPVIAPNPASPQPANTQVVFNVVVEATGGAAGPDGTVDLYDGDPSAGGTHIGTGALTYINTPGSKSSEANICVPNSTVPSLTPACLTIPNFASYLSVASHNIYAVYTPGASGNFSCTVCSSSISYTINPAATATTILPVSPANPKIGQTVTITAQVVPSFGSGTLNGSVVFIEGGTCAAPTKVLGVAALVPANNATTTAAFQISNLSYGTHTNTIDACYLGNSNFPASNSVASGPHGSVTVGSRATSTSVSLQPTEVSLTVTSNVNVQVADTPPVTGNPPGDLVGTIGSMTTARTYAAAALLPNVAAGGQAVLITGGLSGSGNPLSSSEIYLPASGTFTSLVSPGAGIPPALLLVTARSGHTATQLRDGKVLIVGGSSALDGAQLKSSLSVSNVSKSGNNAVYTYALSSGAALQVGFSVTISGCTSAGNNGTFTITALGGSTFTVVNTGAVTESESGATATASSLLPTVEIYDAAAGTVTNLSTACSCSTNNLATARMNHTATLLSNGTVLIAGGYDSDGNKLISTEIYDPTAQTFTGGVNMGVARAGHTATLLTAAPNAGKVLFAGGDSGTAELYNSTTAIGNLFSQRSFHTATQLPDGLVVLMGGIVSGAAVGTIEFYDPVANTFTQVAGNMGPDNHQGHIARLLPDGTVLLASGTTSGLTDGTGSINIAAIYTAPFDPQTTNTTDIISSSDAGDSVAQDTCKPLALNGTGSIACQGSVVAGGTTGSHTITAAYTDAYTTGPVHASSSNTASLTVTDLTVTAAPDSKVYDGTTAPSSGAVVPTLTGTLDPAAVPADVFCGTQAFLSKDAAAGTAVTRPSQTNVIRSGDCSGADRTGAYNITYIDNTTSTITPKALTMSGLSVPASKVYDGTTVAAVSGSPGTLQAAEAAGAGNTSDGKPYTGDTVSITGTATGTYDFKDVATAATVTYGGLSLAGGQAGNYTLTIQSPALATITRKALTMSGLSVPASKVYDGTDIASVSGTGALQTAEAPTFGTGGDGKPYTGDGVSITGTATGTYDFKDVATATIVTFSGLSLTGAAVGNYTLTIQGTQVATITPKPLTVSGLSVAASRVYDGTTETEAVSGTAALQAAEAPAFNTGGDGKPYTSDIVSITGTPTGSYNSKNVATATTVTFGGLSLTGSEAGNYSLTPQTQTATITTKALTMSGLLVPSSKVYDGTLTAAVSGTAALLTAEAPAFGTGGDGTPYTGDSASISGTAAGTYDSKHVATAATVTFSGLSVTSTPAGNYTLTIQGAALATITRKALTMSGLSVPASKVYDGTDIASVSGTGALQTAEAPTFGTGGDGKPYTGDVVSITGTATGTYDFKDVATATIVTFSGLSLSGAAVGNYTLTIQGTQVATITPKPLTVSGLTASSKTYDATLTAALSGSAALLVAEAPGIGSTSDGKPYTGDAVTLGGTPAGTFVSKDVATVVVTVTGNTLSGAQAGDYVLAVNEQPGLTANITPKTLTVSGLTANNKVYDAVATGGTFSGTAALLAAEAPGIGSTSDGKPYTGDAVTLGGTAAGTFVSKDVAPGIVVTVTGNTLGGAEAGNYVLAANEQAGLTADITTKTLTVIGLAASNKIYDATTAAALTGTAALVTEAPGAGSTSDGQAYTGDIVTLGGTAAGAFASQDVANGIAVTVSGNTLSGAQAGNYVLAANEQAGLTANITPKTLTVSGLSAVSKIYDATLTAALSGSAALLVAEAPGFGSTSDGKPYTGDAVTLGGTAAGTFISKDVFNNIPVTVTGNTLGGGQAFNYVLAANEQAGLTADITPKTLTGSITANDKVYDATPAATIATRTLIGVELGDAVTYTGGVATFSNKNVGTGKTVTATGLSLTGAQAGDYTVNSTATTTADITQFALTVSATGINKTYDGTTTATVTLLDNRFAGDLLTTAYTTATFDTASIGGGKTVSVSGISISGTDAPNYSHNTTATTTASITNAVLTITAKDIPKQLGTAYGFTGTEFAVTGLQVGDTLTGVTLASDGALADAVTGDYAICVAPATSCPAPYTPSLSALTGTNLNNYTITFNKGTMNVYRAVAVVGVASELTVDPTKDAGGTFTLTATVSTNSPVSPTRGTEGVSFADNGTPLAGTVSYSTGVAANGTATIVATLGPVTLNTSTAPHAIAATYHGDTNFEPKTTTVYISVAPRPDPIAAGTTGSAASPSVNVTYSGSLTTSGTLSSTDLACDVLPPPGITMDPTVTRCTATLDKTLNPNDSGALTIAIYTDKIASAPPHKPVGAPLGPLYASFSLTMPAIVFMGLAAPFSMRDKRLRRKVLACIGLVLMLSLLLASMGCGGGGFVNKDNLKATLTSSATQAGNYTVRVTYKDSTGSTQVLASMAVLIT